MRSELWLRLRSAWWRIPSSRFRDPYAMTATLMQMSMRLTIAGSRSRTIRTEGSIDRSIERGSERASAAAISFFFSCPRSCLFENEIERARVGQTLNATSLGTHARAFCFPSTSPSSSSSATPSFRLAILSRRLSLFSNFLSLSLSFLTPPPPPSSFRSSLHTRANVSHLGCRAVDNASRKPRSITIQTLIKPMHLSLSISFSSPFEYVEYPAAGFRRETERDRFVPATADSRSRNSLTHRRHPNVRISADFGQRGGGGGTTFSTKTLGREDG